MAKAMRIRKDDQVLVIGGKDAGKTGRVVRTDPKKEKVFVEHLNMVKRHERPRSVQDATPRGGRHRRHRRKGGADPRLQRDAARPQRQQTDAHFGVRRDKGGKRERFAKRSGVSF